METKKAFWDSKILVASLVNLVLAMVTVFAGWMLPADVVAALPEKVMEAVKQREAWAIASAAFSLVIMISRAAMKVDQVETYWKSGAFWFAILAFIANLVSWWTSVPIPENLTTQLVEAITTYATTGDILTFIGDVVSIAIVIFRIFKTKQPIEPVSLSVASLRFKQQYKNAA